MHLVNLPKTGCKESDGPLYSLELEGKQVA